MVRSVPYDSYAPHPKLPGGSTLQPPELGTIARGQMPLHYKEGAEEAIRAGTELHNPLPADDARWRERGAVVWANYCQLCHGAGGRGDGHVATVARLGKFDLADPKSKTAAMKDGQIFHILTYGQGAMASYAGQLSREDRWAVILHVRKLQGK
jgi:mono/diheme cytochrome c family protein